MTRAEEAASKAYGGVPQLRQAFLHGYEQSEKETIECACKWMFSHLPIIVDYYNENIHEQADRDDFIRRFRKDMEEGKV